MQSQTHREHWSSQIGFILAAAGSAIGLGTLWKFPYVTGENGGGLFVFIYILCTFFIGIPIFVAELILGRKAQRGAVGIFASLTHNATVWKGVGWLGVASSFLIMSYYSVLAGWGLNYVFMSLNQFYLNRSAQEISGIFDTLAASGDITIFWHFIFTAITIAVVYPGVRQGIEYWSRFMTSSLLIMLVALCAYTITLDGFGQAVDFLFKPDFSNFKPSSALEALGLSFFTLSLGQGIMLTYGSYMSRTEDIPKTSAIIGSMIILISLLAGLMIFPVIFSFGFTPQEGRGLVFKTLPLLFGKLPGALLISTTFFILFVFTALTSSIALVEVVVANFIDLMGWSRRKAVLVTGISCFIFGIPSALSGSNTLFANWPVIYGKTFLATVDDIVSIWLLPIGGLMISIYTGWFLSTAISKEEFSSGTKWKFLWRPWLFFMRWVAPIAIISIMLQKSGLINVDAWVK
ncbi:MAG: sodium-dependent transporter [Parachlamydiaceae bacterium]|nr:sodium-dependent transporter [Parachlamydiaceae bacterium]